MKEIRLTNGKLTQVDDADYERLKKFTWAENDQGYVLRQKWVNEKQRSLQIRMHREILGVPKESDVDHIDGNKRNNQRSNLRLATRAENLRNRGKNKNNTSGFKGVFLQKVTGRFFAQIKLNRKAIYLGTFSTPEEAHAAYVEAAKEYHGEFAHA